LNVVAPLEFAQNVLDKRSFCGTVHVHTGKKSHLRIIIGAQEVEWVQ
jgi:hypothetical protein